MWMRGYRSDLIPVKVTVGDQVVNALRANSELDWTITSKSDAIEGAKSGKYYAAIVIPKQFSKDMMTFFSDDVQHAELTYYRNEKKNALAPNLLNEGHRRGGGGNQHRLCQNHHLSRAGDRVIAG